MNIVGLNCLSTMPKEVKANVEKARSETVAKLWRVTEQMNILYPENWTRMAAEEILWFQGYILMSYPVKSCSTIGLTKPKIQWTHFYSFLCPQQSQLHSPLIMTLYFVSIF